MDLDISKPRFRHFEQLIDTAITFSQSENGINSFPSIDGVRLSKTGASLNGSNANITPEKFSTCQRITE